MNKITYLSSESSLLIRKVSFVAFVMVVLIHSQVFALIDNLPTPYKNVQGFLFQNLTAWAVPYFFSVSGFFFAKRIAKNMMSGSQDCWRKFFIGKIKSLLLPYIFWTIICTIMALPIVMGCNYVRGRFIFDNILYQGNVLSDFFGVLSWRGPKFAGHLWFLRSLMIVFLLSPLFMVLFKMKHCVKFLLLLSLYLMSYVGCAFFLFPLMWFLFGFFYFSSLLDIKYSRTIVFSFFFIWIVSSLCSRMIGFIADASKCISVLSGMTFFIGLVRLGFMINIKEELLKPNFFYYCSHIIFTSWCTYVLLLLPFSSLFFGTLVTLFVVCCGVICPIVLYRVSNKWMPKTTEILMGGRV